MTEIRDQARRESFEQDQERYRRILESQKAQREAQMDDLRPLPERHALCSLHWLPALFRFAALAILFVGLLLTIRAVTEGPTTATARAKTPRSPAAPSTSAPGASLPQRLLQVWRLQVWLLPPPQVPSSSTWGTAASGRGSGRTCRSRPSSGSGPLRM